VINAPISPKPPPFMICPASQPATSPINKNVSPATFAGDPAWCESPFPHRFLRLPSEHPLSR
jgi:hypothetical protein